MYNNSSSVSSLMTSTVDHKTIFHSRIAPRTERRLVLKDIPFPLILRQNLCKCLSRIFILTMEKLFYKCIHALCISTFPLRIQSLQSVDFHDLLICVILSIHKQNKQPFVLVPILLVISILKSIFCLFSNQGLLSVQTESRKRGEQSLPEYCVIGTEEIRVVLDTSINRFEISLSIFSRAYVFLN